MSRHAQRRSDLELALKLICAIWVPVWLFLAAWVWLR